MVNEQNPAYEKMNARLEMEWAHREYKGLPKGAARGLYTDFAKALAQKYGENSFAVDIEWRWEDPAAIPCPPYTFPFQYAAGDMTTLFKRGFVKRRRHPSGAGYDYVFVPEALRDLGLAPETKHE